MRRRLREKWERLIVALMAVRERPKPRQGLDSPRDPRPLPSTEIRDPGPINYNG